MVASDTTGPVDVLVITAGMGHTSFAMTQRHYAQESALSNVQTALVSTRLQNGAPTMDPLALSDEQLVELLGRDRCVRVGLLASIGARIDAS